MAPNASQITVASNGTIYVANISGTSTTYPTSVAGSIYDLGGTLPGGYREMGYANEDGVTFTITPSVDDINAWQSATPVRRLVTTREFTAATNLMQWNDDTFSTAFGGGSWVGSGTSRQFLPPADQDALAEFAVIVDAQDGTRRQRWVIERANVTDAVSTQLVRTGAAVLPVTFSGLTRSGQVRAWYFFSDDSAF